MAHDHPIPNTPESSTAGGQQLDMTAAMRLIGAAYAGCRPCQEEQAAMVVDGASGVIVNLACAAYVALARLARSLGVTGPMTEQSLKRFQRPTRDLFRIFNRDALGEAEEVCEAMTPRERRLLLEDATEILIGLMSTRTISR